MNETLLLIEDNISLRENTAELLELAGYKVIVAGNGREGLELARKSQPALILCDIMMPELDGYGVLRALENIPELVGTPFIFLTSKSEKSDFRKGMDLGADDYLIKPFEGDDLLRVVAARLKKSQFLRQKLNHPEKSRLENSDLKSLEDLLNIPEHRMVRRFKKKEFVYTEDENPNYLFYVKSGKVKAFRTNDFGKEYITGIYKENEFFGYTALIENSRYKESAETLETSEILCIPKEDFLHLLHSNHELSLKLIKLVSNNLSEAEDKLIQLAYNSARKRVAESLLFVASIYRDKGMEGSFSFPLNREDLSAIAGIAAESVSRNLTDFRSEGLIETKNGQIKILDWKKMENLKN